MKLFIISDIHGSFEKLNLAIDKFNKSKSDKLILLGDLYYHGPRNPLPSEYNPKECANLLNQYTDKIIAIKGNCDAEVDEYISKFPFNQSYTLKYNDKTFYFAHGHHEIENPSQYDVIFLGHTHIKRNEIIDGVIYINPGSISLPKADNSSNYIIVENNTISFYDINNGILTDSRYF